MSDGSDTDRPFMTPFAYPGGKGKLAPWIADHLPAHDCYVEPFGGAAAVLFAKPRSHIEVYNDLSDDVTTFFRVVRDRPADLREYLDYVEFSYQLHQDVLDRWFDRGERPDDDIRHAAEFLFLRVANHNSMFRRSGFSGGPGTDRAGTWESYKDRIETIASRFCGVTIDSRDYARVVDQYDEPGTVFYFDPPYYGADDPGMYDGDPDEFDHAAFASTLDGLEGDWLVSYADLPPCFERDDWTVNEKTMNWKMSTNREDGEIRVDERLVMNFDPETRKPHVDSRTASAGVW